ncbi:protocatechuate 4,5-dioxygenase subunit alpha [Exilibacterium tricleocarpae]|uniref:Protocatechuate 4,5-dioxygenase subunit alpha n=1 Tax=Exilibacterium tricleocarpae TaxID=2591008 RepID=A0A545T677_9GAMM|nr:protocatechuate 4,5-dioxygenase subunit alpha [Exilibacterium tricleocarpae]TQV72723.1 protocatechuate 4,5-dioxygenase subunit alpha [Exilibacterium tricleocarpae]
MSGKDEAPEYGDIPGTYVFDGRHSRRGYHLNMFCMSLNRQENREVFRADEAAYLKRYPLTSAQRQAVLERDWLGMLRLGGNIYYTFKLAIFDGLSMQNVGGQMSGITEAEFKNMMIAGGRPYKEDQQVSAAGGCADG